MANGSGARRVEIDSRGWTGDFSIMPGRQFLALRWEFQRFGRWLYGFVRCCDCDGCFAGPTYWTPAQTMYAWDGVGKDPNAAFWACAEHQRQYNEHWQAMWDEYNYSRG
jgi:hypothetical protein